MLISTIPIVLLFFVKLVFSQSRVTNHLLALLMCSQKKYHCDHSDFCGPMSVGSLGGARYFVTFTDDYSRFSYVYFLKHKSEVFKKFKEFHAEVTNFINKRIKTLRTDNGGEYTSFVFEEYLKKNKIRHEVSIPHTPQQNGISERLNHTLQEMAMSQILHAGLLKCFWADSVATACYVHNRLPVCPWNVSPFEKWYARKPNLRYLRVFGCVAYALKPDNERTKMDARSVKLRFIGYPLRAKGYRLYEEKKHRVIVRRDVIFNETVFDTKYVTYPSDVVLVSTPATDDNAAEQSKPQSHDGDDGAQSLPVLQPVRRSQQQVRQPDRLGEWIEYIDTDVDFAQTNESKHHLYFCNVVEPKTIDEAMKMPEAEMWKQAADEEMLAHNTMNTWKLVSLPDGRKTVGCKWVFRVKNKSDGTIERFKARLVAKGFIQQPGTDFNETFAPVVRLNNLRSLLAYAIQNKLLIHQMDIVTAFLHGHLQEEVYMEQPPEYVKEGQKSLVCLLQRSLYGFKQSPKCWNDTFCESFCEYMKELGYVLMTLQDVSQ